MMLNIVTPEDMNAAIHELMKEQTTVAMVEVATGLNKEHIIIAAIQKAYHDRMITNGFTEEQIEKAFTLIYTYAMAETVQTCEKCKKYTKCTPVARMQSMGFTKLVVCETYFKAIMTKMGDTDATHLN